MKPSYSQHHGTLARLGKRWTVWATVFVIPLTLIVAYIVGAFAMAFIGFPRLS